MPVGFFRGGGVEPEIRDSILMALRRGPHESQDLIEKLREVAGRPSLRPSQIQPTILRLADRGFVAASKRGGQRMYALTIMGHGVARQLAEGVAFDDAAGEVKRRPDRRGPDEPDDESRASIARVISGIYEREGFESPDELQEAAGATETLATGD